MQIGMIFTKPFNLRIDDLNAFPIPTKKLRFALAGIPSGQNSMNDKFRLWTLFVDQSKDIQDIGNDKAIGTLTDKDIVCSNEYKPNFGVERFQDAIFQVPK